MRWNYNNINADLVLEHSQRLGLTWLHSLILLSRGLDSKQSINDFYTPENIPFHDPFLLEDMEKAVLRIDEAIQKQEKVLIYGDYDVDGITSASALSLFFGQYLESLQYYIPDREKDGYGLSKKGIEFAGKNGITLIITCDCGITSFEEIISAKKLGIDTVVTDHHKPSANLPEAVAIVNPKREDDNYPFKDLCGAGVVFKMIQAFLIHNEDDVTDANEYLDLIAMGTAADMVSITGENRKIVAQGLKIINRHNRIGLNELIKISKLHNKSISVTEIVFIIAPRLNAVGRLGEASRAVKLLTTEDVHVAREYSGILDEENKRRREIEKEVMDEAIMHINYKYSGNIPKVIVLADDKWHSGVIGIVCSKLKELYNRPIILITITNGIGKGSGRSVTGFDLYEALAQNSEYLDTFGGHIMAAGLTIKEENINEFENSLNIYSGSLLSDTMLESKIHLESDVE
ncbi:MAG: single-stranded-DNA-specific exonuclease RecJ, partial [Candidatus Marinimicrobia bacterium]|nr:single-stranded-DNA-specific exonuclease RecJ [Candidatus Neomarinimicrobiota bacterium]